MSFKLIMTWDIKPGMDQDYFEFVVREWVPVTNRLGLQTVGAWYTVYSREDVPQIMSEAIADEIEEIRSILDTPEWNELREKLSEYVVNYNQKIVRTSGGFQI